MDNLTVFAVWATWTSNRGEPLTRSARLFPTCDEAMVWYNQLRDSFKGAQGCGMVKHFTMHLEEQHLEPSKEVRHG